jgi:hypothetical protein
MLCKHFRDILLTKKCKTLDFAYGRESTFLLPLTKFLDNRLILLRRWFFVSVGKFWLYLFNEIKK